MPCPPSGPPAHPPKNAPPAADGGEYQLKFDARLEFGELDGRPHDLPPPSDQEALALQRWYASLRSLRRVLGRNYWSRHRAG